MSARMKMGHAKLLTRPSSCAQDFEGVPRWVDKQAPLLDEQHYQCLLISRPAAVAAATRQVCAALVSDIPVFSPILTLLTE